MHTHLHHDYREGKTHKYYSRQLQHHLIPKDLDHLRPTIQEDYPRIPWEGVAAAVASVVEEKEETAQECKFSKDPVRILVMRISSYPNHRKKR